MSDLPSTPEINLDRLNETSQSFVGWLRDRKVQTASYMITAGGIGGIFGYYPYMFHKYAHFIPEINPLIACPTGATIGLLGCLSLGIKEYRSQRHAPSPSTVQEI